MDAPQTDQRRTRRSLRVLSLGLIAIGLGCLWFWYAPCLGRLLLFPQAAPLRKVGELQKGSTFRTSARVKRVFSITALLRQEEAYWAEDETGKIKVYFHRSLDPSDAKVDIVGVVRKSRYAKEADAVWMGGRFSVFLMLGLVIPGIFLFFGGCFLILSFGPDPDRSLMEMTASLAKGQSKPGTPS